MTLRSYERGAALYREATSAPPADYVGFLDAFARRVGDGQVLELGSGPGDDAIHLSRSGVTVVPTDGARSFVEMMKARGLPARQLDVRTGDFGGPYAGVLANAVLLHLSRTDLRSFLARIPGSLAPGGVLGFTLKEGDGEGWSYAKLGAPRHFTYWREPALRDLLASTGWEVELLDEVEGRSDQWLFVLASRSEPGSAALPVPIPGG